MGTCSGCGKDAAFREDMWCGSCIQKCFDDTMRDDEARRLTFGEYIEKHTGVLPNVPVSKIFRDAVDGKFSAVTMGNLIVRSVLGIFAEVSVIGQYIESEPRLTHPYNETDEKILSDISSRTGVSVDDVIRCLAVYEFLEDRDELAGLLDKYDAEGDVIVAESEHTLLSKLIESTLSTMERIEDDMASQTGYRFDRSFSGLAAKWDSTRDTSIIRSAIYPFTVSRPFGSGTVTFQTGNRQPGMRVVNDE